MSGERLEVLGGAAGTGAVEVPRVRRAVPADYARIAELTVEAYAAGGHMRRDSPYMEQLADVGLRADHGELLVVELDGAVVASAVIVWPGTRLAVLARPGEMEFRMLAVDPQHQGRGAARTLLRELIRRAEEAPGTTAIVLCSISTMTAAHALYRSEGFVDDPARDLVIDGVGRFPFFARTIRR